MSEEKINVHDVDNWTVDDALAILNDWNKVHRQNVYPEFDDDESDYFEAVNKRNRGKLHSAILSFLFYSVFGKQLEEGQRWPKMTPAQIKKYDTLLGVILERIYNMLRDREKYYGKFQFPVPISETEMAHMLLHTWKTGKRRPNVNKRKRE